MFPLAPLLFIALVLWIARGAGAAARCWRRSASPCPCCSCSTSAEADSCSASRSCPTRLALIPVWRAAQLLNGGVDAAQTLLFVGAARRRGAFAVRPAPLRGGAPARRRRVPRDRLVPGLRRRPRLRARARRPMPAVGDRDWVDDAVAGTPTCRTSTTPRACPATTTCSSGRPSSGTATWATPVRLGPAVRDPLPEQTGSIDPVTGRITAPALDGAEVRRRDARARRRRHAGRDEVAPDALPRRGAPLRLASAVEGVYGDGWMGSTAAYTAYAGAAARRIAVTLSREAWGGKDVPGKVVVRVGPAVARGTGATRSGA